MEARRPSNQAVDTREPDPRLKSAKPRGVRFRSLTALAVCGFLAIAAILTLPMQAEAQTTIWSSTLTVKEVATNVLGCNNFGTNVRCSTYLSDDTFTHDGTTYKFQYIFSQPSGQLQIDFDVDLETATQNLTLNVDGTAFAFKAAASLGSTGKNWGTAELNWTAGDTVALTLTDSTGRPATPAAPSIGATEGSNTSLDVGWLEPANAGPNVNYDLQYQRNEGAWTNGPQNITAKYQRNEGASPTSQTWATAPPTRYKYAPATTTATATGRLRGPGRPTPATRPAPRETSPPPPTGRTGST